MILVSQYDSPFVRRVAISLRVLGLAYEHDTRSVFGDFDVMRTINPVGRSAGAPRGHSQQGCQPSSPPR
jgi:glutathione S-transferase